jgi:uncharacterized protein
MWPDLAVLSLAVLSPSRAAICCRNYAQLFRDARIAAIYEDTNPGDAVRNRSKNTLQPESAKAGKHLKAVVSRSRQDRVSQIARLRPRDFSVHCAETATAFSAAAPYRWAGGVGMFKSKIFACCVVAGLAVWAVLFTTFGSVQFWLEHWYYAAMMVGGAFVAGFTPEGGGAVAFPVLSVFVHVDRVLARDFSMMIQSVGMTSASIFILTHKETILKDYKPLFIFVPVCFVGLLLGMLLLQQMHVYIIQALFLCLSATFVVAYYFNRYRGSVTRLIIKSNLDRVALGIILVIGGMITSLFGTGADIVLYTLLITRFGMTAKIATRMSIVLQASLSILGFGYRAFLDHGLTAYQIKTWLCAYPVVLFMAPLGAYVLSRLHVNWMLRAIIALNVFQLLYFNLIDPSAEKVAASLVFTIILATIFFLALRHMAQRTTPATLTGDRMVQGPPLLHDPLARPATVLVEDR